MRYKLLPHRFKRIGWLILLPALILAFTLPEIKGLNATMPALVNGEILGKTTFFTWVSDNLTLTLYGSFILVGAMLVCFSREKTEDEYIAGLRLNALLWAVLAHALLLLFAFLFVYGTSFIPVVFCSMFTPLLIFITRFHYLRYRHTQAALHEKHT